MKTLPPLYTPGEYVVRNAIAAVIFLVWIGVFYPAYLARYQFFGPYDYVLMPALALFVSLAAAHSVLDKRARRQGRMGSKPEDVFTYVRALSLKQNLTIQLSAYLAYAAASFAFLIANYNEWAFSLKVAGGLFCLFAVVAAANAWSMQKPYETAPLKPKLSLSENLVFNCIVTVIGTLIFFLLARFMPVFLGTDELILPFLLSIVISMQTEQYLVKRYAKARFLPQISQAEQRALIETMPPLHRLVFYIASTIPTLVFVTLYSYKSGSGVPYILLMGTGILAAMTLFFWFLPLMRVRFPAMTRNR